MLIYSKLFLLFYCELRVFSICEGLFPAKQQQNRELFQGWQCVCMELRDHEVFVPAKYTNWGETYVQVFGSIQWLSSFSGRRKVSWRQRKMHVFGVWERCNINPF